MSSAQPPLPSPGVCARRRGPKNLPRLPLSVFTPPSSGTAEKFPAPPTPGAIHPKQVVDAQLRVENKNGLQQSTGDTKDIGGRIGGVVIALNSLDDIESTLQR